MILTLTIAIIIWLALTCVYFINEDRQSKEMWKLWQDSCFGSELENMRLREELLHWKRPRDSKGRFR